MKPDNELLRHYAKTSSEEAFTELVRRHVDLVYSVALRLVGGDAHLAHDAAQSVFIDLARKAHSLARRSSLSGWLYTSAYFAASKIARTENRRRQREEQFMHDPSCQTGPEGDWQKLRPLLDSVMHELKEADREAILLRYFENRPFAEVGAKLSVNENTARMRVERALEKLRSLLARRGVTAGATLAAAISANAVQTAPAGLVSGLTAGSVAAAATPAATLAKIIAATKFKLALGTLAIAGVLAALELQHRTSQTLRQKNESLQGQVAQLQADAAANHLAAQDEAAKLSAEERNELLKLRSEMARLPAAPTFTPAAVTPLTNDISAATNAIISLRVKFVSLKTGNVQSLRPALVPTPSGTCVLSGEQSKFVDDALHGTDNEISRCQITTGNTGRGVHASVTRAFPIGGTNAYLGTDLSVTPYYSSSSALFTLNLSAQLSQLTGDRSRPGLQTIQIPTNQVALFAGQTVVLQKDIPASGWLPEKTNMTDGPRTLLVFVTPAIVDPAVYRRAAQQVVNPDQAMAKMNDAKQGVVAMLMFASDNNGQLPTNLDQVSAYLKDNSIDEMKADYEILDCGSLTNVPNPSSTIVLREKQAWQNPDGKWLKTYGFADGHSEVHMEPNGDFTQFEKDHTIQLPGE